MQDVDTQLADLFKTRDDFSTRGLKRSALRVTREILRLSKTGQRLIGYIDGLFYITNDAQSLFDVDAGVEASVELIAILESEDRARAIQPDFAPEEYDYKVHWLSSCAYDNLATHTAVRDGYNSDSVHGAVNEGIQVCRRTGKLECVTCFREYATDVYSAADDLEMALHYARLVSSRADSADADRRYVGARDEARILLIQGHLDAALTAEMRALELAATFHSPYLSRIATLSSIEGVLLMLGREAEFPHYVESVFGAEGFPKFAPGEYLAHDFDLAKSVSLRAGLRGDFGAAIAALSYWDRWFTEHCALANWLEVRLRLIALHRLDGRRDRIEPLAHQLETRAKKANDWLSLRRLARLLDENEQVTPLALVGRVASGPFATIPAIQSDIPLTAAASVVETDEPRSDVPVQNQDESPDDTLVAPAANETQTKFNAKFEAWGKALAEAGEGDLATFQGIFHQILAISPAEMSVEDDVRRVVWLLSLLCGQPLQKDADARRAAWEWGEKLAEEFPQQATILGTVANLGAALHGTSDEEVESPVDETQIENLYRQALDLDTNNARNYANAGLFQYRRGNGDEAERLLARSFRLNRGSGDVACQLAEIYADSDRRRDALAVLDMCLREGNAEPQVLWDAALNAMALDNYSAALTYLDKLEEVEPGQIWANYYRTLCLLDLKRPAEALVAAHAEREQNSESGFPIRILEACAEQALGHGERFEELLDDILEIPLSTVANLTMEGLTRLFTRLWNATRELPDADPKRRALEIKLIASGLAPNEFFENIRQRGEMQPDLNFYVVIISQPLDSNWKNSIGCLAGQGEWESYRAVWGVLAPDEDDATQQVLTMQSKCYPLPPEIVDVTAQGENYNDRPGVVWQSLHEPQSDEADGDDD